MRFQQFSGREKKKNNVNENIAEFLQIQIN
jgi:hypothetical protein